MSQSKHAVIEPVLKKINLDSTDLKNVRPISKLPFINKILEKVVHNQLTDFLCGNNILDIFQSGFRTKHSTESALLKVPNNILLSIDSGKRVALMMLDLTAAFDTLDHAILIERLRDYVGIKGVALKWFSSYLQDRTCLVKIGNHVSSSASITWGVPQGSILGPTLFSLYMLPLGAIFRQYNINYHMYADDRWIVFRWRVMAIHLLLIFISV